MSTASSSVRRRPRSRSRSSAPTTATRSPTRTRGWPIPRIRRPSPTWRRRTRTPRRPPGWRACGPRSSARSRRAPRRPTCPSRCARAAGGEYSRTVEGQQYAIFCRRRVLDGEVTPPLPEDGKPLDGEEVLLDGNELAAGAGFFSLGALLGQPGRVAAGLLDRLLRRRAVHAADQGPGDRARCCPTRSPTRSTAARGRWTRPRCSTSPWTRRGGRTGCGGTRSAPPAYADVIVFEEADERFWAVDRRCRAASGTSASFGGSKLTSDGGCSTPPRPTGAFAVVAPRRQGVEYDVEDAADRLLDRCTTTVARKNFELATAPLPGAGDTADVDAADPAPRRHPAARRGRVRRRTRSSTSAATG